MQAAALPDYPAPLEATVQPVAPQVEATAVAPSEKETAKPVEQTGSLPAAQKVAASCPGNPDALGTSRVLTITPAEFSRIGTMQYKQTLPLNDHEVVLTFDDGPIPPYSNIILDTLESQCVKATYFMVGEMAQAYPAIVRRIYNAGMTIGTHSQTHPFRFQAFVDAGRRAPGRRRYCLGRCRARRCKSRVALLPHSRPRPHQRDRALPAGTEAW